MIPKELDDQTEGKIIERQSTFIRFVTPQSNQYKIDYIEKKEFLIDELSFCGVRVLSEHPLLEHYKQPTLNIYISSKVEDPSELARGLSAMVNEEYRGWRTVDECFNPQCSIESLLEGGYGLLYSGPSILGQKVITKLEENGIKFSTEIRQFKETHTPKVLLLGNNAIVAEEFRCGREKS